MARRSEGKPRLMIERQGERLGFEAHHRVLVPVDDLQIRVGAPHFDLELGPHLGRLGSGEPALSGAEPHQYQFVVLTALELERPPVGPVGNDGLSKLGQRQRPMKPGGIRRSKVPNDLLKESLQVVHVIASTSQSATLVGGDLRTLHSASGNSSPAASRPSSDSYSASGL